MKTKALVLILTIISAVVLSLCVTDTTAFAYSADEIEIEFSNNQTVFTPDYDGNAYTFDYSKGMNVKITAKLSGDPDAKCGTTIMLNGELQNGIFKAGTYDVTVNAMPSDNSPFVYKTFKVTVNKMSITNVRFDEQSINVEYGNELTPKLLIDQDIENNSVITYEYFLTDGTTPIEKPMNYGEYRIKATIEGDNYFGSLESTLTISKSNAGIEIINRNPETEYEKSVSDNGGFDITSVVGASIVNANADSHHELEVYIKVGDDYVLQNKVLIPGVYEYKICFKNSENYYAQAEYGVFTVSKAQTEIIVTDDFSLVYSFDDDIVSRLKSLFGVTYNLVYSNSRQSVGDEIKELLSFNFYKNNVYLGDYPTDVGEYELEIALSENDFYSQTISETVVFRIIKRDISSEIVTYGEQNFDYGVEYEITDKFTVPSEYDASKNYTFLRYNLDGTTTEIDSKPNLPGKYAVILTIDSDNYFGTKTLIFSISKLPIEANAVDVTDLSYTYGDTVNVKVSVADEYGVSDENVKITYKILNGDFLDKTPVFAGNYQAIIQIETEIYAVTITKDLVISKKELKLKAIPREVIYGDDLFVKDDDRYLAKDFTFDGLISDNDIPSILSSITVKVGDYISKNFNMTVGDYPMEIVGDRNPNYVIVDGGSGTLSITKRTLNVKTGELTQYVGYAFSPTIMVSNSVYNDLPENMALLFETYYALNGIDLTSAPSSYGEYEIKIRVKADNVDCQELKNYTISYQFGKLTLLSAEKTDDLGAMIVEGKFDRNVDFQVKIIKPNANVQNAVKSVASNYEVSKLLYIPYTFETVDSSSFILKIDCSELDTDKMKIMIGYSSDSFEEVEYSLVGNHAVIRLSTMASYYAICTEKGLPLMWIIIISVGACVIVIGLAVFLIVYFTGANVKAKKDDHSVELSGAVVRNANVKTEDDELDELIENFDESTVVKKEDPAQRLKREQEEELREQYRQRLRRLRNMGDKSLNDQLERIGIEKSDFDEEKAIDKLMRDDMLRKQKEEEQLRKKQKEEADKKQKETSFVINERKSGTLGSGTMPITPRTNDIIDDDDIDV